MHQATGQPHCLRLHGSLTNLPNPPSMYACRRAVLLMQNDVTSRIEAENVLTGLSEGQVDQRGQASGMPAGGKSEDRHEGLSRDYKGWVGE